MTFSCLPVVRRVRGNARVGWCAFANPTRSSIHACHPFTRVARVTPSLRLLEQRIELLLVRVIVEIVVKIIAALHQVDDILLMTIAAERLEDLEHRSVARAPR